MNPIISQKTVEYTPALGNDGGGKIESTIDKIFANISFGAEAFMVYRPNELPRFEISEEEIEKITNRAEFAVRYPYGNKPPMVRDMIRQTAKIGWTKHTEPLEKERNRNMLRYTLFLISDASPLERKRKDEIQVRLIECFLNCQPVQIELHNKLFEEVCNIGTLASRIKIRWERYKMDILDGWIIDRHPVVKRESHNPVDQLDHIKSAYKELLADSLGFPGREVAVLDPDRPKLPMITMGESDDALRAAFKRRLDIKDFVIDLCNIINDSGSKLIPKDKVLQWGNSINAVGFGYYKKEKSYEGIPAPTEDQKDLFSPYISPSEIISVMVSAKILNVKEL